MSKYCIYTMENEKINKEVQDVLSSKRYEVRKIPLDTHVWYIEDGIVQFDYASNYSAAQSGRYKEITFRELTELPPMHDTLNDLAEKLLNEIEQYLHLNPDVSLTATHYCKIWEKMKPKLGL